MKQTAVEWLVDQMFKRGYFEKDKPLTFTNLDHLVFEAKEMEKQMVVNAWNAGFEAQPFKDDGEDIKYYNDIPVLGKSDAIVDTVISKYKERSIAGIKKYGTTLERNNKDDYLKHLQEELMDATLYIQKLMKKK